MDELAQAQDYLHVVAEEEPADTRLLDITRAVGLPVPDGGRVLDLGCGIGDSVSVLLDMGFDAVGVDIIEYWGSDADAYWKQSDPPAPEIRSRLHLIDPDDYRFPFPDSSIDFCFSSQVMEHVFDHRPVFSELRRVLRPGATSLHIFPGPLAPLRESHINVPLAPFCRFRAWLLLFALLGVRSERQHGLGWRETYSSNRRLMDICNYPTKRALKRAGRDAGVEVGFVGGDYIRAAGGGSRRLWQRAAKVGLGRPAVALLEMRTQRRMTVSRSTAD